MVSDRIVLCGGSPAPALNKGQKITKLFLSGPTKNVNLRLDDISENTAANLPPILIDLLEIAAYVYSADQAATRGGEGVLDVGARWRRNFNFFIPVRKPDVWSQPQVTEVLTEALNFLSEDTYTFTFAPATNPPPMKQYLEGALDRGVIDQVLLFSGGLDSLGGAVQEAVIDKRRVALVSHRSTPKMDRPQQDLVAALAPHCRGKPPLPIPVWVNKEKALGVEGSQRTRSFLFASLGVVVARMFGLTSLRFYENGITSINLPVSEQLVGVRASRTTHPQALGGLARLFGQLLEQDFRIENPFIWKTKTEVVNLIGGAGCSDLIKNTISCIDTRDRTNEHTHCGLCSQCVGRRFATLASGFANADSPQMYKVDLLTGGRSERPAVTLLESLIRAARSMKAMTDRQFFATFGEASRVINHLPGKADDVAASILDLHRRYGADVSRVLARGLSDYAVEFNSGRLPETCAITLAVPEKYKSRSKTSTSGNGSALDEGVGNGKKRLSTEDQRLYDIVGEQRLTMLTNAEILRRKTLIQTFDRWFDADEPEAVRARLNRIRKHHRLPSSASLKRKVVNPPPN